MNNGIDPAVAAQAASVTIGDLLVAQVQRHPDRIAIVDGGRAFTFRAFNERVNRLASVLRSYDIGRGERVAILSENRAEYPGTDVRGR